jgi:glycosyltransferase involved in cell wall biosynthesis
MKTLAVHISIVVPVFNSRDFLHKLLEAIDEQRRDSNWSLELILVDDGSKDGSYSKIEELSEKYPYIKGIKLARNFGHQAAVRTGLSFCKGDYVAIIDDDLQDPPSLLPMFFEYLDQGYDVAFGVRRKRKENIFKKISYRLFYRILQRMSSVDIPLDTGDFCVMKKCVVENMLKLEEKNPFLRGMRAWVGFKQIGVEYERQGRVDGESGYTLKKLLKIALDGIFSFSVFPIKFITALGLIGLTVAILYSCFLIFSYFSHNIEVRGFTTLALLVSFFGSLILICLGFIGEYIVRIYDEVLNRPHSVIEKTLNI